VPDFPNQHSLYAQAWQRTFQQNLDRIAQWEIASSSSSAAGHSNSNTSNLDVVFLGDSITEHWRGTSLSSMAHEQWSGNAHVFHSHFGDFSVPIQSSTTNLMGMPLGIARDRCPNLLYRLQNGELSSSTNSSLQPAIFWILIGTNDVGGDQCRDSQVIASTITIVKYIQQERPNAKIVLNSILPYGKPNETRFDVLDHWRKVYQPINQAMDCFVQGFQNDRDHGKLYFFNATDLFLTSDSQSINYTLLPDGLHPEEEGSWVWGMRAMVEKIQDILAS
jgi:lysophospholipase L1-like esterase